MSIEPDDLVRYRDDGPRVAHRGLIGIVWTPSEKGVERGWVRVGFCGSGDEYSPDELERPHYWAFASSFPAEWAGPYNDVRLAKLAVCRMIADRSRPALGSPLEAKQEEQVKLLLDYEPQPKGLKIHLVSGGEFGIMPAGEKQPGLYDEKGRKYA